MAPYELMVIMRAAVAADLTNIIKRTAKNIADRGGLISSMENLGTRQLPYVMRKHGERFTHGSYILFQVDAPTGKTADLLSELHRDTDVVRPNMLRKEEEEDRPCKQGPCFWGDLSAEDHKRVLKIGRFRKLD